jgi:hypothetical protein
VRIGSFSHNVQTLKAAAGVASVLRLRSTVRAGWRAGENASVVPDEAPLDLANRGPDANVSIPLMVRITLLLNVDQLTSFPLAGTSLKCQLPTSGEPPLTTLVEHSQSSSLGGGSCSLAGLERIAEELGKAVMQTAGGALLIQ